MCYSSSIKSLKFLPFFEPLVIKAIKNSPPHIVFEELYQNVNHSADDNKELLHHQVVHLNFERSNIPLFAKRIQLAEMVVQAPVESISHLARAGGDESSDRSWIQDLSQKQLKRLEEAQYRGLDTNSNWSGKTWTDHAKKVLENSQREPAFAKASSVEVFKIDEDGRKVREVPLAEVRLRDPLSYGQSKSYSNANPNPSNGRSGMEVPVLDEYGELPGFLETMPDTQVAISGAIEITGGLAITNEHHIEIRRRDEGIIKELGRVDLVKGTYSIEVERASGEILARLMDRSGTVLGEGVARLNSAIAKTAQEKIRIEPNVEYTGVIAGIYNSSPFKLAPNFTRATFYKGAEEVAVKPDGHVRVANIAKNSFTVLRTSAPQHLQTIKLINAGQEFRAEIFPESMIKALRDIVENQRGLLLADNFPVIWGQAKEGEKTLEGVAVELETDTSLEAIYFNAMMLPDAQLKQTSKNGYFAFVGVSPGLHSLLAVNGKNISYVNAIVEESSVAHVDIEFVKKKETIPVRVYDAFSGHPATSSVAIQGLEEEVMVENGTYSVTLPYLDRMGLIYTRPENPDYIATKFIYNDKDAYIHLPLVKWDWLNSIRNFLRISDHPSAGSVIGFVPDEDFEVFVAEEPRFESQGIVYFDMHGKILQGRKGIAGGGFILFNLPSDIQEVVVIGARDKKVQSKVIVVDPASVSALIYRH